MNKKQVWQLPSLNDRLITVANLPVLCIRPFPTIKNNNISVLPDLWCPQAPASRRSRRSRRFQLHWNAAIDEDWARSSNLPARGGALTEVQLDQTWSHWAVGTPTGRGFGMLKYIEGIDTHACTHTTQTWAMHS